MIRQAFCFSLMKVILISGTFIINYVGLLACMLHATDELDVNALVVGCAFGGSYLFVSKVRIQD